MSQFPKAKPTRKPKGKRKRQPATRAPCMFVASGHRNHRNVEICRTCGGLYDEPQHALPPASDEAREIDERRAR